jgi:hypothetical protein
MGGTRTYGFTITEHLSGDREDIPLSGSKLPGLPTSTYEDQHSILLGKFLGNEIQRLTQTFTASNVPLGYIDIPVFVRGFKNSAGVVQDNGSLALYKTAKYIKINDDYGGHLDQSGKFIPNKICGK